MCTTRVFFLYKNDKRFSSGNPFKGPMGNLSLCGGRHRVTRWYLQRLNTSVWNSVQKVSDIVEKEKVLKFEKKEKRKIFLKSFQKKIQNLKEKIWKNINQVGDWALRCENRKLGEPKVPGSWFELIDGKLRPHEFCAKVFFPSNRAQDSLDFWLNNYIRLRILQRSSSR